MKIFFSILALVFVLSSFGSNTINEVEFNKSNEKIIDLESNSLDVILVATPDCFDVASAAADSWMTDTGGTWEQSVPIFDEAMSACEALEAVLILLAIYMK